MQALGFVFIFIFHLFLLAPVASEKSLSTQYQNAYSFALQSESFSFSRPEARKWALEFLEKHAVLSHHKSLQEHYADAYNFASTEDILKYSEEGAEGWAKRLMQARYRTAKRKLVFELDEFLDLSVGSEETASWILALLGNGQPFYAVQSPLSLHREIRDFLQRRAEFAMDSRKAQEIAGQFIQKRYFFPEHTSLAEQYLQAYEYALDRETLNLSFEAALRWAKIFITKRSVFPSTASLTEQYRFAYDFALQTLLLDDTESRAWSLNLILTRGRLSPEKEIGEQFREAYIFAYTGDFLPILYSKNPPRSIFLFDYANEWAEKFLLRRGVLSLGEDLVRQYESAFWLAYSSAGLRQEREAALLWAQRWIERDQPE